MATKIRGMEGLQQGELDFELQRGAKFVLFQYCISVIILTFRRPSDIYFMRAGENPVVKGLPFTLVSLVAGWWGIPLGADLYGPVDLQQFARGPGRHASRGQFARGQAAAPAAGPIPPKN